MSPTHTAASSKHPSKMSKGDLLQLYNTTASKKDGLVEKYGKVQKKYKHAKKVLATRQDLNGPVRQAKIAYPTRETPGRGNFNLATYLFECSAVSKEDYNAFIALIHKAMIAAGIPATALWRDVAVGPLSDVLDVTREQYPWLGEYANDWPTTKIMIQYLRNNWNGSRRKVTVSTAAAAAAAVTVTATG